MAWARLDDGFYGHPKVLQAGLAATGLHVLAISYCSRYLTDGHVSTEFVRQTAGRSATKLARNLVEAGLWECTDRGWIVHDYLDYNPSRADVIASKRGELRGPAPDGPLARAGASAARARSRAPAGRAQPRVPVPYPFPKGVQA
jgi:hypothetical protein